MRSFAARSRPAVGRSRLSATRLNYDRRSVNGKLNLRRGDTTAFARSVEPDWTTQGTADLHASDGRLSFLSDEDRSEASVEVGDWLIPSHAFAAATSLRDASWTSRIASGFGTTCGKIGIVIALAAVIGCCLLDSGAANRIVRSMRNALGERNTPGALLLSGFVIGIPVYFDTVFYLLLPLARTLGKQSGKNYLLYILSIIVGATMAHSLVPPTPGPLLVASELNVGLGQMILAGLTVGLITAGSGFLFAVWVNRRMVIPIRDVEGQPDSVSTTSEDSNTVDGEPPLWLAMAPIVLPVVLLSLGTLARLGSGLGGGTLDQLVEFVSDKHIALGLASIVAVTMLVRYAPKHVRWTRSLQDSMLSAGNIVLITAAGGAFGHVLRQSGIAAAVQQRFPVTQAGLGLLVIAFVVTAIVRVAQGSATVAMITAVGIVAPLVQATDLPFPTVFVALAIGCGSKPMPWMNDSGFWVITRMSGMTESESLRTFSVALTVMGVVGLLVTLLGAALFSAV